MGNTLNRAVHSICSCLCTRKVNKWQQWTQKGKIIFLCNVATSMKNQQILPPLVN